MSGEGDGPAPVTHPVRRRGAEGDLVGIGARSLGLLSGRTRRADVVELEVRTSLRGVPAEVGDAPSVLAQEVVERALGMILPRVSPVALRDALIDDEVAVAGAGVVGDAAGQRQGVVLDVGIAAVREIRALDLLGDPVAAREVPFDPRERGDARSTARLGSGRERRAPWPVRS